MEFVRDFSCINRCDACYAGGKGASLGCLSHIEGVTTPPGFVILAEAFDHFFDVNEIRSYIDNTLHSADLFDRKSIEQASKKITELIMNTKMPENITEAILDSFETLDAEYVAVRSSATVEDSATAAWAGQLESFLNTTKNSLLENVKKCWASLFTSRAIYYRLERGLLDVPISVAIVVQKMIASEKSGTVFSVHPITGDTNQLIIEAGFGLGEAIVSGQITPDSYVVQKDSLIVVNITVNTQTKVLHRGKHGGNEWQSLPEEIGEQQTLNESEMLTLANTVCRIERQYGCPCDIEWASEEETIYILQARPITTLSS